ncbi:MAG: M56 family metallopeptidase [Syntrophomonadaceae bacterium]|nr:M56 family metallopeptidase [Syntrophomonadaceae bacterium]
MRDKACCGGLADGAGGCAVFFMVTHIRYRRDYKAALSIDNEFVSRWLREHPTRRNVQIRQSDKIAAPLTYGIWKPVVLLPKTTDWTDETKLRYILTHEFVHIKRFDFLSKWLLTTACLMKIRKRQVCIIRSALKMRTDFHKAA